MTLVVETVVVAEAGEQMRGVADNVPEPVNGSGVESGSGTVDGAVTDRLAVLGRLALGGATVIEGIGLAASSAAEGFVEGDRQLQGVVDGALD